MSHSAHARQSRSPAAWMARNALCCAQLRLQVIISRKSRRDHCPLSGNTGGPSFPSIPVETETKGNGKETKPALHSVNVETKRPKIIALRFHHPPAHSRPFFFSQRSRMVFVPRFEMVPRVTFNSSACWLQSVTPSSIQSARRSFLGCSAKVRQFA